MKLGRRSLLAFAVGAACSPKKPAAKPELRWGVQSGEVDRSSAVIWSRADIRSKLHVEWSLSPSFERAIRVEGPIATEETDFTAKVRLTGLPSGSPIHYRAWFDESDRLVGTFGTAPSASDERNVLLAWSADVNGQGWGFDPMRGGMPSFTALRERKPELFLHCGDGIYADVPITQTVAGWDAWIDPDAPRGAATSLTELRTKWRYARNCQQVRDFSAAIPMVATWDDHEVTDNWAPGLVADALIGSARRAMYEHLPTLRELTAPMYRVIPWGPLVDVFLLDGRSGRQTNTMFGEAQTAWLIEALAASRATWKIVAMGQPIAESVLSYDAAGGVAWDTTGNEPGPPKEREVELARILSSLKQRNVKNVVWVSADVHYGAATRFDPSRAAFKDFDPFWELIAGPMHARTFPANPLDDTFGPEREWISAKAGPRGTGDPANGEQYMGLLAIDGKTKALTVTWIDARGRDVHRLVLAPG